MSRFTCYLNDVERDHLRRVAENRGVTESAIIRLALRKELGLPTGTKRALQLVGVTGVTRNKETT